MTTLTQRAEQALIGALLTWPWQFVVFEEPRPGDFADRRLARIYGAMVQIWGSVAPDEISGDFEEIAARAKVSPPFLEYLKQTCPVPRHAGAYSELVVEASARREIRAAAAGLEARAKTVGYGTLSGHSLLVAAALKRNSALYDPDTMTAALAGPAAIAGTKRETAEESVLAAILAQHRQTLAMLEILRPTAWSDPARREMHAAMAALAERGRDIDPLTVDWEISRGRERNGLTAGRVPAESAGLSYAAKITGMPVTGNPVQMAKAVVAAARKQARQRAGHPAASETETPSRQELVPGTYPARGQHPALLEIPPQAPGDGHVPGQKM